MLQFPRCSALVDGEANYNPLGRQRATTARLPEVRANGRTPFEPFKTSSNNNPETAIFPVWDPLEGKRRAQQATSPLQPPTKFAQRCAPTARQSSSRR